MATIQARADERLLIGGEWVEAAGGERFDVTNPATGEVVGTVPNGTEADVRRAIDAAAGALEELALDCPRSSARASCASRPT